VPIEAEGGAALGSGILRRGLFDAELAITAASSGGGHVLLAPRAGSAYRGAVSPAARASAAAAWSGLPTAR
jgi:hypothetical protein